MRKEIPLRSDISIFSGGGDISWLFSGGSGLDPDWEIESASPEWIGDVHVSGETKRNLYQPYLQVNHLDQKNGLPAPEKRTIAPNGSFSGAGEMKITPESCEYENALKDYRITIKQGYLWKSKPLFKEFISELSLPPGRRRCA